MSVMSSHSFSSSNPIALLAGVALINTPGELDNLHIPCRARSVSSAPESPIRPLRRSSTSNSLPCTPLLRPRCYSPSPRLSKPARGKLQARIKEDKVKRSHKIKCMISQASKIKSISNSPANPEQQLVLLAVYRHITQFPSEYWQALLAVSINRTLAQVRNWFSNMRQKKLDEHLFPLTGGADGYIVAKTVEGDTIKFRPHALESCPDWSDDIFEGVIALSRFSAALQKLDS